MSVPLLLVTAVWLAALPPGGHATDPPPGSLVLGFYPPGWPYYPYGQGADPYSCPYRCHVAFELVQLLKNQLKSLDEKTKSLESKLETFTLDEKPSNDSENQSPQVKQNQLQQLTEKVKTLQTQVEKNSQDVKVLTSKQDTQKNQSPQVKQDELQQLTEKMKTLQTQVEKNSQDVKVLTSKQDTQKSQLEQQGREQEGRGKKLEEQSKKLQEQTDRLQDNSEMIQHINDSLTCKNIDPNGLRRRYRGILSLNRLPPVRNVALKKPTTQSSYNYRYFRSSELAVDGNKASTDGFCQETGFTESTIWWMVDLQKFYEVVSVKITNRGDGVGRRLRNFNVEIYDINPLRDTKTRSLCYHHARPMPGGSTKLFKCSKPLVGRYVRVSMPNKKQPMHVCEVEVLARTALKTNTDFKLKPKRRAEGKILKELTVKTTVECLRTCIRDTACNAFNVGPKKMTCDGWRGPACQILSYGGIQEQGNLVPSDAWNAYLITSAT